MELTGSEKTVIILIVMMVIITCGIDGVGDDGDHCHDGDHYLWN